MARQWQPEASIGKAQYVTLLESVKTRIRDARVQAGFAASRELLLYWDIGSEILRRQGDEGWGTHVIDRLSGDLKREFPQMRGE